MSASAVKVVKSEKWIVSWPEGEGEMCVSFLDVCFDGEGMGWRRAARRAARWTTLPRWEAARSKIVCVALGPEACILSVSGWCFGGWGECVP